VDSNEYATSVLTDFEIGISSLMIFYLKDPMLYREIVDSMLMLMAIKTAALEKVVNIPVQGNKTVH
jgi:hypothetical protein